MSYPNLCAEMARCGISQSVLADTIGYNKATVNRWMIGKNSIPMAAATKIRDTFFAGMSIDYLFSEDAVIPSL